MPLQHYCIPPSIGFLYAFVVFEYIFDMTSCESERNLHVLAEKEDT